jgi:predicted DCC family thiol-disulfide oxidoreductase YuxK
MQGSVPSEIEVFYDGGCPVCLREVRVLRRLDRRGRICFTDIDAPGFQSPQPGPALDDLMARIHARNSDGSWVHGVEVFRRLYAAVGFAPLVAVSRLPGVSHLLDRAYAVFARNRVRWFGRCTSKTCANARPQDRDQAHAAGLGGGVEPQAGHASPTAAASPAITSR